MSLMQCTKLTHVYCAENFLSSAHHPVLICWQRCTNRLCKMQPCTSPYPCSLLSQYRVLKINTSRFRPVKIKHLNTTWNSLVLFFLHHFRTYCVVSSKGKSTHFEYYGLGQSFSKHSQSQWKSQQSQNFVPIQWWMTYANLFLLI